LQLLGEHERYSIKTGPVLFDGAIDVIGEANATPAAPADRPAFAVDWVEHNLPAEWPEGSPFHLYVRLANRGSREWLPRRPDGRGVELRVSVDGRLTQRVAVPRVVAPGQEITLGLPLRVAGGNAATEVTLSLVPERSGWFSRWFSRRPDPLVVHVSKSPPATGPTANALTIACRSNSWGYQPTQGIAHGRDRRPYPLFIREARGCRIHDLEGNEWVDYVMGWGSALLGYAHPQLQAAVMPYMSSGAVLSLPHGLEMELTAALCDRFPGAEAVLFGKNGSDVCTAAVRMARLYTNRRKVLFSGYHGWQDWYAEAAAPGLAAPAARPDTFRFRLNDFNDFHRLVKDHRDEVAAVVLEPAAQVEGVDGPVQSADSKFLANISAVCRRHGIVLIFDEIMTGFRHPGGSVQHATGVTPDLTCLGKALTSGWPLSALLGGRKILESTMGRIFYHPTFKGEAHSFAAALGALRIYESQDVPGCIYAFGKRLMDGVTRLGEQLGVAGRMIGQPYRMVYEFLEPDIDRRALKRTLLIQELMKRGILTFRGFLLPSLAHSEEELTHTLAAYDGALRVVCDADADGSFARRLEIPLVI
jgi:glutamate-1-semialdehyde aminotransferase